MKTQDLISKKIFKSLFPVSSFFKERFSPRFFSHKEISDFDLKTIFEAARFAPSSYNLQPWYFYVAKKNDEGFKKLSSLVLEFNDWAKEAPVLILAVYEKKSPYGENTYAPYDLGQAVISLIYQAQILGYHAHQIAGFDKKMARKIVKENEEPFVMIALGKIGDYQKAPEEIVKKDNVSRERKEKIFEVLT